MMNLTKQDLEDIRNACKRGARLRELVNSHKLTEKQASEIISRPREEVQRINGARIVPFPSVRK